MFSYEKECSAMIKIVLLMVIAANTLLHAQPEYARILVDLDINTPQVESVKTAAMGTLLVGIVCQKVVNLDTYSFDVAFNPAVLSFERAVEDNPIGGLTNILKKNAGQTLNVNLGLKIGCTDTVNINNTLVGSDSSVAPDGDGLMGIILFNVLQAVPCTLTVCNAILVDYEGVINSSSILSNGRIIQSTAARDAHFPANKNGTPALLRTAATGRSLFADPAAAIFDMRGRIVSRPAHENSVHHFSQGMFIVKPKP
jgi:hypothetical protein